jgi:flagellar protein FlaJ
MSMGKKKEVKQPELRQIIGFTKPKKILFFKTKPKPIYGAPIKQPLQAEAQPNQQQQPFVAQQTGSQQVPQTQPVVPQPTVNPAAQKAKQPKQPHQGFFKSKPKPAAAKPQLQGIPTYQIFNQQDGSQKPQKPAPKFLDTRIKKIINKQKDLELSMREQNIKGTPYTFIQKIMYISIGIAVAMAIVIPILFYELTILDTAVTVSPLIGIMLGLVGAIAGYMVIFNNLILYPVKKARNSGKEIEKDVLFAARDMIIAMRSGMPLYNAIVTVSTGYGTASREFGKIVETVQLGTPIENAIDSVCLKSKSPTFNRIMLQSSTSIKAGADVIGALQEAIDEVSQERVIELRRYGQRLNALAMFYMLFGIIFPSMGIAVATIMTTFISIITINNTTLAMVFVGIVILQFVFLNMIRSARPVYAT